MDTDQVMSETAPTVPPKRGPGNPPARPRKPPVNPLVKPKRPGAGRQQAARPAPTNNPVAGARNGLQSQAQQLTQPASQQPAEQYVDTPIYTTKRSLLEGKRHHIMRLIPNTNVDKPVDPTDQSQFTRPVRLHRRDPRRDPTPNYEHDDDDAESDEKKPGMVDDKGREAAQIAKAARAAERDAARAQIAPTAKAETEQRKKQKKLKKTEMVYQFTDSAVKVKNQKIRYEEALPWHLEDFDNRTPWAATYESALSETHIMLVEDLESRTYRMVPLEKWYKFLPKSHITKFASLEEARKRMEKKGNVPAWLAKAQLQHSRSTQDGGLPSKLYTRRGERGERPTGGSSAGGMSGGGDDGPEQAEDADVLDYDYEEAFADDEENPLFGGDDDENKEAEKKIKQEQAEANIFKDIKEEKDFDAEELLRMAQEEQDKEKRRKVTKALKKRERDWRYDDDSEEDSDDSSEDEEEEKENKEDDKANGTEATSFDKPRTTDPTKRTSTPKPENIRNALKRPNSPNQSDLSGNESSQKKQKRGPHLAAAEAGASISRTSSPANQGANIRKPGTIKLNASGRRPGDLGAGSGSEGERSDASRRKKKAQPSSRQLSPVGSRPASPANVAEFRDPSTITAEEMRALIPPEGLPAKALQQMFGPVVFKNQPFVALLKEVATMNGRILMRKEPEGTKP